jgi:hypothetical protein
MSISNISNKSAPSELIANNHLQEFIDFFTGGKKQPEINTPASKPSCDGLFKFDDLKKWRSVILLRDSNGVSRTFPEYLKYYGIDKLPAKYREELSRLIFLGTSPAVPNLTELAKFHADGLQTAMMQYAKNPSSDSLKKLDEIVSIGRHFYYGIFCP